MDIKAIQKFHLLSGPYQPFISENAKVADYQEEVICWNPIILKKGGLAYQFTIQKAPVEIQIVPDGCLNFLFRCGGNHPEAWVFGITTEVINFVLEEGGVYFGLKPYSPVGLVSKTTTMSELVNKVSTFNNIFQASEILLDKLSTSNTFEERKKSMLDYAYEYILNREYRDLLTEYLSILLCQQKENFFMHQIKTELGYSNRYTQRRFQQTMGISPKQYSRIIRFQNCLKELLASSGTKRLTDIAASLDYYDQSHLIHDFRCVTHKTPLQFKKEIQKLSEEEY